MVLGRISIIPLSITFCIAMVGASDRPFLGPQILDAFERQQGWLFASVLTSTLIPVFNLFQLTKIEEREVPMEMNITKTIDVQVHGGNDKGALTSSAASLSPSMQTDTKQLLEYENYDGVMAGQTVTR